jgi:hypothetical protein
MYFHYRPADFQKDGQWNSGHITDTNTNSNW